MTRSNSAPPSDRSFGLCFALLCGVAGFWKFAVRPGWLVAGAALLIVALLAPALLRPLNLLWYRFGLILARVMNPVVMALVYLIAIVPVGMLWKLTGRDPLRLRFDRNAPSYWISRADQPQSMLRQF